MTPIPSRWLRSRKALGNLLIQDIVDEVLCFLLKSVLALRCFLEVWLCSLQHLQERHPDLVCHHRFHLVFDAREVYRSFWMCIFTQLCVLDDCGTQGIA